MTTAVGVYMSGDSWLYRLDPRPKLWFSLLGVAACLTAPGPVALIGVLAIAHLVLIAGGLPMGKLGRLWRNLAPLVLVILILQPILTPGAGAVIVQIGPLRVTQTGMMLGLIYALRVAAAAFVALVPILTTPINTLVRGLQKLGLPYTWSMTVGLALRYLGTIGELYTTISESQQARGWGASTGGLIERAKTTVPTVIALIIASLRLADTLALSMAARGFGMDRPRAWRQDIHMSRVDWAAAAAITAGFVGFLIMTVG
ncbi:MAG: energy-coupling factor transporter transmembrane protein EcfT [Anaerolineae bacterium]|nr:energy-coupling factor transporter transmembrane protein EcfT [Anaerolineae bacterium]